MPLLTSEAATELSHSIRTAMDSFRARRRTYAIGFAFIAVAFALVALFRLECEVTDIPLLLVAGVLHTLAYVGLYLLVWTFVIAKLLYESTLSQLVERWFRREAARRPNQSFSISNFAYWRMVLLAGPLAVVAFIALAGLVVAAFFVLPLQVDALAEVLHGMLPRE